MSAKNIIFKIVAIITLAVTIFSPMARFVGLAPVPRAEAQIWPGLLNQLVPNEEPDFGGSCSNITLLGGIISWPGECVPIEVSGDPYRKERNDAKAVFVVILAVIAQRYAVWVANRIDQEFRINDFLSYAKTITDQINKDRWIFKNINNPLDRLLTSISYDNLNHGGVDINSISGALNQKALPNRPTQNPNDPNFYLNLARSGMWLSDPYDWYHIYNAKAMDAKSGAQAATAMELASSQGYKSSRNSTDVLDHIMAQKTLAYYSTEDGHQVRIMTPGGYAAEGIKTMLDSIMRKMDISQNNNLFAIVSVISNIIFSGINGGIFKGNSQALVDTIGGVTGTIVNPPTFNAGIGGY